MRRAAMLAILLAVPACSPPAPPVAPESPAILALREETAILLRQTTDLLLVSRVPIPDGGSVDFTLRTDAGVDLVIEALYEDPMVRGPIQYQKFILARKGGSFELLRDSALEGRLLDLLARAKLMDTPDRAQDKKDLIRLHDRLRTRSLK